MTKRRFPNLHSPTETVCPQQHACQLQTVLTQKLLPDVAPTLHHHGPGQSCLSRHPEGVTPLGIPENRIVNCGRVSADSSAPWDLGSASLYHTREAILPTSAPRGSHTHPCTCQQGHWPETQPQSQQQPHNLTPASLDHKTRGSPISSRTRQ